MKRIASSPLLFAFIAFMVGLNLRPILASIGPLFTVLQREVGLSATAFSLLTTLPVAMMGVAAFSGPWLLARAGAVRGILAALFLLFIACIVRGVYGVADGADDHRPGRRSQYRHDSGVNACADKKRYTASASTFMSLFSTGIMAGAALAAASAEPLFSRLGLQPALATAGALALVAWLMWLPLARNSPQQNIAQETVSPATPRTGWLLLFLGLAPEPTRWCWPGCRLSIFRPAGARAAAAICWPGSR